MTSGIDDSGVKITEVRVSNFRSLKQIAVVLNNLTVLLGANNTGKTSFLDAMYAAMGAGRKAFGQEDIFITPGESLPPKDRVTVIDVMVRPVGKDNEILGHFPGGSFWTNLWGDGISQDEQLSDFMAFRTSVAWSMAHGEYVITRKFLKEWRELKDWLLAEEKGPISIAHIEPIALHYIDAKRDLDDDLKRQGSFWRRLTEDLGLTESDINTFETALSSLNQAIIDKSEVLRHLRDNLGDIQSVVAAEKAGVDIAPVARRLRDLSKGVDVTFSTPGAPPFPLTKHGMGTRSLASLLVFRAFVTWKKLQAGKQGDHIHSLLALEEPEAHLHPQAQRAMFTQIKTISGQRIVSTHSPYFAGQAKLEELRLFSKKQVETQVMQLDLSVLKTEDRRKLDRMVIASRGDLLFSRALILFEGETEEQALPVWAEKYWGRSIHELGFSFVGIGGDGHYFPFVWLAKNFGINYYVFSDGDKKAITRVTGALARVGITDLKGCSNVILLPNENNFESQLLEEGYQKELEAALVKVDGDEFLLNYINTLDGKDGRKKDGVLTKRDYSGKEGRTRAVLDAFSENKTRIAATVAATIVECAEPKKRIPKCVLKLFDQISKDFGLEKAGETK